MDEPDELQLSNRKETVPAIFFSLRLAFMGIENRAQFHRNRWMMQQSESIWHQRLLRNQSSWPWSCKVKVFFLTRLCKGQIRLREPKLLNWNNELVYTIFLIENQWNKIKIIEVFERKYFKFLQKLSEFLVWWKITLYCELAENVFILKVEIFGTNIRKIKWLSWAIRFQKKLFCVPKYNV